MRPTRRHVPLHECVPSILGVSSSLSDYARSKPKEAAHPDDSTANGRTNCGDRSTSSPVRRRMPTAWSLSRSTHGEHRSTAPAVARKVRGSHIAPDAESESVGESSSAVPSVAMKLRLTTMPARTCIAVSTGKGAGKSHRNLLQREVTRPEWLEVTWEKHP